MVSNALHNDIDLVGRGHKVNPDWHRNFREDQDRTTKIIGRIIDMELGGYIRKETMLSEVYFTKYWGWTNYCLVYRIKERYNNIGILIGSILQSTDEVLRWYDLTTKFNFNILIVTPYETLRFTYLDLLYEYVTMPDGKSIDVLMETHPRAQQMEDWVVRNPSYQRVTRKTSEFYDPYTYRDNRSKYGGLLQLRADISPTSQQHRDKGIMSGYYNYDIDNLRDQRRQQQMSEYVEPRQIVKKESVFKRMINKLKLK
jgi:hypothetical protein